MSNNKPQVLITGGAGFIGSHLTNTLIDWGYPVAVIDNLKKGKKENISRKALFIKADIRSTKFATFVEKIKPNYVFHLAAQTSISDSFAIADENIRVNLIGTLNVLESVKDLNIKRIIFSSSAAVYGASKRFPISEDRPKLPISTYGISKLSAECLFDIYYRRYKIPYTVLRYANVYGENQDSSVEGGVVAIFINKILKNQKITIYGNGNQTRDFIYVSDIISANLAVMNNKTNGIYNVGTSIEISVNKLVSSLAKITKKKISKDYKQPPCLEVSKNSLSYLNLNRVTGWKPETDILKGLEITFKYFRSKHNNL